MSTSQVVQFFVNALALGSVYALATLGLVIVFGIARLFNFAYGELIMVSGYALWALTKAGVPWPLAAAVSVIVPVIVALIIERVGFRPLRGSNPTTLLISSFAMSTFLQTFAIVYIWPRPVPIPMPSIFSQNWIVGSVRLPTIDILTIVITFSVFGLLTIFLKRTIIGIALRAASEDFTTTRLMGIRANAVIATAFAIEGFLAGLFMILWVGNSAAVFPTIGLTPVLIAFMAGSIGSMQSLVGSVVGGFIVGFLFTGLATVLPTQMQPLRQAILFAIVVLILVFRPQGLFPGAYEEEIR